MKILETFESSCDETAVAVVEDGRRVFSDAILSQADMHALYGGVVPEIASRKHVQAIAALTDKALADAGRGQAGHRCRGRDLLTGAHRRRAGGGQLCQIRGLCAGCAPDPGPPRPWPHRRQLSGLPGLEPPFLALAMSGGNTLIVDVRDYTDLVLVGATRDDAAGECFDKAARVLGLPYPGGRPMDQLAQQSAGGVYDLPRASIEGHPLDMSFSGLKTVVVNLAHNAEQKGEPLDRAALARDFTRAVSDELVPRAMLAARMCGRKTLVAAGGVGREHHPPCRPDGGMCARGREAVPPAAPAVRR